MADYGFKRIVPPGFLKVSTEPPKGCMAKGCPYPGEHDWVEVVADLGIVVQGKICDHHKTYLEALPALGYVAEWVTGL